MTWYTNTAKQQLDYSKPICGDSGDATYLLLPHWQEDSYFLRGYDWFNLKTGKWNSCVGYGSVEEALMAGSYINIRNCEMKLCEV